jgi:hypothetical protein
VSSLNHIFSRVEKEALAGLALLSVDVGKLKFLFTVLHCLFVQCSAAIAVSV